MGLGRAHYKQGAPLGLGPGRRPLQNARQLQRSGLVAWWLGDHGWPLACNVRPGGTGRSAEAEWAWGGHTINRAPRWGWDRDEGAASPEPDALPYARGVRWQGGQGGATPLWIEGPSLLFAQLLRPPSPSGRDTALDRGSIAPDRKRRRRSPLRPPNSAAALQKAGAAGPAPLPHEPGQASVASGACKAAWIAPTNAAGV